MHEENKCPLKRTFQDLAGNTKVYTYPDGSYDLIIRNGGWFLPDGWEESVDKPVEKRVREPEKRAQGADMVRSRNRARAKLRRLALANGFTHFVTLTLDPAKIDRMDGKAITKALNTWLDNMVRRHGLRYILVPERHKDGAFHFHGFMAGPGLRLEDSGTLSVPGQDKPRKPRSKAQRAEWLAQGARVVYNLPQWKLGFSTALELSGDYHMAVAYVVKYVGKQENERPLGRWYFSGGGLIEPKAEILTTDWDKALEVYTDAFVCDIPGAKLAIVHSGSPRGGETDVRDHGKAPAGEPIPGP